MPRVLPPLEPLVSAGLPTDGDPLRVTGMLFLFQLLSLFLLCRRSTLTHDPRCTFACQSASGVERAQGDYAADSTALQGAHGQHDAGAGPWGVLASGAPASGVQAAFLEW
jgi:hypothetical protein